MAFSAPATSLLIDPVVGSGGLTTTGSATAPETGSLAGAIIRTRDGRRFQQVKNDSSGVAIAAAGAPVVWQLTTTDYVITPDISDNPGVGFAGVACAVITDTYWGFIQTKGKCNARVSGNVTAGDALYVTNDGYFDAATVGTHHVVAVALTTASPTEGAGFADIMLM